MIGTFANVRGPARRVAAVVLAAVCALTLTGCGAPSREAQGEAAWVVPMPMPEVTSPAADPDVEDQDALEPEPADPDVVEPEPSASPAFEYLPVIRRGTTDAKRIAVTVDDCFQVGNLREIIDIARDNGAKLTLFPIGENLQKAGMPALMRRAVFDLGFEVENHTWSHQRIFRLPEREMAGEIWRQRETLNRVLGVNYEQHFFRLMGGDGSGDQRTHSYLRQLDYRGIADWSISGSDADMGMIRAALKPGAVYLFHTTDADTEKLRRFIPWVVAQGYELVTLNALLGYEENAIAPYTPSEMPEPAAWTPDGRAQRQGDYAWCVVGMQDRLRALGLLDMDGPSTGYFGPMTAEAVRRFQRVSGLPCTGVADADTQRRLMGE